jgi:hypothetical protein
MGTGTGKTEREEGREEGSEERRKEGRMEGRNEGKELNEGWKCVSSFVAPSPPCLPSL